jgi:aryl-alcohol dehydrogenase-like predicted oxidoreductase
VQPTDVPLVLGGHSFIHQLGNDPPASEPEQRAIVESCLAHDIRWFDTTYQPERSALGRALQDLGRRDEATILAWNFFRDFGPADPVGEPEQLRPEHIEIMLEQLRTSWIDCLVLVPLHDPEQSQRQEQLAIAWQKQGYVRSLGRWVEHQPIPERDGNGNAFRFAVQPCNLATRRTAGVFAAYKKRGWNTVATSPFFRGWELDKMVAGAAARGYGEAEELRSRLADAMLRLALFTPGVDRLVVAMRRVEWVRRNVESAARGPLTAEEHRWLRRVHALTDERRWWPRLRRRLGGS